VDSINGSTREAETVGSSEVVAFSTATSTFIEDNSAEPVNNPTPAPLLPTVTPGAPETPTPGVLRATTTLISSTATPAPVAATATLTVEPTSKSPAVTAAPGQLEILSHQSYVDSLGWYHIVGEVQNNSTQTMGYVEVVAKFYDTGNEIIGTKLTFTAPDVIFPGSSAPFDIIALRQSQWQNIATYTLEVKGEEANNSVPQNLVLVSQTAQIEDELLVIDGQVKNVGETPALVKLIVTLYDANNNVINTGWSYADDGIIVAASTSDFEVKVPHNTDPNNFHYRIQIEEEPVDSDN
jgi:hypothetical protein